MEHGTTWHAHGPAGSTRYMSMCEGCRASNQRIQVWGEELIVSQRSDCVEPLVVGEEEQDIRLFTHDLFRAVGHL